MTSVDGGNFEKIFSKKEWKLRRLLDDWPVGIVGIHVERREDPRGKYIKAVGQRCTALGRLGWVKIPAKIPNPNPKPPHRHEQSRSAVKLTARRTS